MIIVGGKVVVIIIAIGWIVTVIVGIGIDWIVIGWIIGCLVKIIGATIIGGVGIGCIIVGGVACDLPADPCVGIIGEHISRIGGTLILQQLIVYLHNLTVTMAAELLVAVLLLLPVLLLLDIIYSS